LKTAAAFKGLNDSAVSRDQGWQKILEAVPPKSDLLSSLRFLKNTFWAAFELLHTLFLLGLTS
jgi:hypothetical protein